MGLYTQLPNDVDEVDVIIAGGECEPTLEQDCRKEVVQSKRITDSFLGGTAGCIVAARLSDADPDLRILVIEGGQNNYNDPAVVHPLLFLSHLLPTSKTTLFYKGNKEKQLGDRELVVPAGGLLGGGSSINLLMYTRAQRHDFDSWQTPGWSAEEMLPYLKRVLPISLEVITTSIS